VSEVFALVWKDLKKPEVEIPEMDLYILRDSNVGSEAWFNAGNGQRTEIPFLVSLDRRLNVRNTHFIISQESFSHHRRRLSIRFQ